MRPDRPPPAAARQEVRRKENYRWTATAPSPTAVPARAVAVFAPASLPLQK
eukprot:gene2503-5433_t